MKNKTSVSDESLTNFIVVKDSTTRQKFAQKCYTVYNNTGTTEWR